MNTKTQYLNVPNPTGLSCLCRMPWAGPHLIFAYPSGPGLLLPLTARYGQSYNSWKVPTRSCICGEALSYPLRGDRAAPSVPLPKAFPLTLGVFTDFHSLLCSKVTKISFLTTLYEVASSLSPLSHCPRIFSVVITMFSCLAYLFVYLYVVTHVHIISWRVEILPVLLSLLYS